MGSVVSYSVMSGIALIPLYLIVKLLLSDHARPEFNRAVILASYAIALLVPAMVSVHGASMPQIEIEMPTGIVVTDTDAVDLNSSANIREIAAPAIVMLYFAGLLICLIRETISWTRLRKSLKGCRCLRLADGRRLLLHDRRDMSPFSWRNVIVMSRSDYEEDGDIIILHESRHLDSRHWVDLVFAELVSLFIWYNPAGWLMKNELQTIHEYEADEAVMHNGVSIKEYQLLIIKKAVGGRLPSITNSLEQSNLSKRIKMMLRKDSSRKPGWRAIAVVPAVAIGALVLNVDVVADTINSLSDVKVTNYIPSVQEPASSELQSELQLVAHVPVPDATQQSSEVYTAVDQMPQFPGGEAGLMQCITKNIHYPKEAMEQNVQGRVIVQFVVTSTGKIGDIKVVRGVSPELDREAIRVIGTFPDFIPGKVNGKPVSVWYTLPISFRLSDDKATTTVDEKAISQVDEKVLTTAEEMPRFPGGEAELMHYLAKNIRYPKEAMEQNVQGRVIVQFVVTSTGKIGDIKVVRGVSPELDREAIRVMGTLPDFIPGKVNGKPVSVWYTLPISFRLSDDKDERQSKQETPLVIETTPATNSNSCHNNPLVVIDGTPRDINGVKPDDIESITVLKDDNAKQLYGEAGANGVIIITTKKQQSAS